MDDLVHLLLGGGDHLRVAVTGVDDGDPGEAIDVLGAVRVPDGGALGLVDHDRLDRGDEARGDELFVLGDRFVVAGRAHGAPFLALLAADDDLAKSDGHHRRAAVVKLGPIEPTRCEHADRL